MKPGTFLYSVMLSLLIAIPVLATDAVFVAVPKIGEAFSADSADVQFAMSFYLIAYAATQLVYGPLSDRHGRRMVLLVAMIIFTIGSLICAMSTSLGWLALARALQGIGAGSGPTLVRAIIRDRHGAEESIRLLSYIMAAFGAIAVITPIIGGRLVAEIGWQAVFYFGAIYGFVCVLLAWLRLSETRSTEWVTGHGFARYFQGFAVLVRSRDFLMLTGANTAIYGAMFVWIAGSVFVLVDGMEQPEDIVGDYYAVSIVGFVVGSWMAGRLQARLTPLTVIAAGIVVCLAASAVGWAIADIRDPFAVIGPGFVIMIGIGLAVPPATAAAIAPFPEMAGAASALIGFVQMGVSALTVIAADYIYDGSAGPMMMLMAVLSAVALAFYTPFMGRLGERMITR